MYIQLKIDQNDNAQTMKHLTVYNIDRSVIDLDFLEHFPKTQVLICKGSVKSVKRIEEHCKDLRKLYIDGYILDQIDFKKFFLNFAHLEILCMNFNSSSQIADVISYSYGIKNINGSIGMDFPWYKTIYDYPKYTCPEISITNNW